MIHQTNRSVTDYAMIRPIVNNSPQYDYVSTPAIINPPHDPSTRPAIINPHHDSSTRPAIINPHHDPSTMSAIINHPHDPSTRPAISHPHHDPSTMSAIINPPHDLSTRPAISHPHHDPSTMSAIINPIHDLFTRPAIINHHHDPTTRPATINPPHDPSTMSAISNTHHDPFTRPTINNHHQLTRLSGLASLSPSLFNATNQGHSAVQEHMIEPDDFYPFSFPSILHPFHDDDNDDDDGGGGHDAVFTNIDSNHKDLMSVKHSIGEDDCMDIMYDHYNCDLNDDPLMTGDLCITQDRCVRRIHEDDGDKNVDENDVNRMEVDIETNAVDQLAGNDNKDGKVGKLTKTPIIAFSSIDNVISPLRYWRELIAESIVATASSSATTTTSTTTTTTTTTTTSSTTTTTTTTTTPSTTTSATAAVNTKNSIEWNGFYRVKGITTGVKRFKTIRQSNQSKHSFDVNVYIDDSRHVLQVKVSSDLVEKFLDMTADDYHIMRKGLDKETIRLTKLQVTERFKHFHGVFWVYNAYKHVHNSLSCTSIVQLTDALLDNLEADDSKVHMTLVDYAHDDIKQLCRHMITNYYYNNNNFTS